VRATVEAAGGHRHPAEVEAAAYFSCRTALECVAAGAGPASGVTIRVTEDATTLRLAIDDAGSGLEAAADRINLEQDWIEALGGVVSLEAGPGRATRLSIVLPLV
jgi:signal transduction histidine kinase